ncbi:hypothetical protein [Actinopolyspora saharensis]|nr:hypothetical protein [Actinopolyspora saharensis]
MSTVVFGVITGLLTEILKLSVGGGLWALTAVLAALTVLSLLPWGRILPGGDSTESSRLGIILHLHSKDEAPSSQYPAALEHAKSTHQVVERIDRVLPRAGNKRSAEIRKAYENFHELVTKHESTSTPTALYSIARLPDAYEFGRHLRYELGSPTVMQADSGKDSEPFFPAVRLNRRLSQPLSANERTRVERLLTTEERVFTAAESPERIALIIALAPSNIAAEAAEAARTGRHEHYAIASGEKCDAALIISAAPEGIPRQGEIFELVVRHVRQQWTEWLGAQGHPAERLLFLGTPASVGVAVGYLFSRERIRLVPYQSPAVTTR